MKILIAFADEAGRKMTGAMGPEEPDAEKLKIFFDAKQRHRFPKGVKRFELLETIPQETAIWIGDHVAEEAEAFATAAAQRAMEKAEKDKAIRKRSSDIQAATKALSETSVKRSQAQSKLLASQQRLADATANAENTKSKFHDERLAAEKKMAEAAEKEFKAVDQAWVEAKAAKAALEPPPETAKA